MELGLAGLCQHTGHLKTSHSSQSHSSQRAQKDRWKPTSAELRGSREKKTGPWQRGQDTPARTSTR